MKSSHRIKLLPMLAVLAAICSGCNTIQGAGQDIERVGDEIEDVAQG